MRKNSALYFALIMSSTLSVSYAEDKVTVKGSGKAHEKLSFEKDARPILKAHCFECHGEGIDTEGGMDLRLRRFILKGGDSGQGIVVGNAEESVFYQRIQSDEMPPGDTKLTKDEKAVLKKWIIQGAITEKDEPKTLEKGIYITEDEKNFWSFRPIQNPQVPKVKNEPLVKNPVDSFLLQKLEANNLRFSSKADSHTLIRRVYFDLIGLPPSPEEVDDFVSSKDPKAYEKLIDKLIASKHYGERWGRHWLDVVGYADSEGYTIQDPERKHAFRYRDYVIRSFNEDKPFDQFIREQLAGDEMVKYPYKNLTPEQADLLTATGFLRMAPDGTAVGNMEQELARNQVMADTLQVVGSSLLGLTLNCAQCHNHRYDPIPQTDYYHLRAIFEPAYDWKKWRRPSQRLVSLYTDEDRAKAAAIEVEAKKIDVEYKKKSNFLINDCLEDQLLLVPEEVRVSLREAFKTAAKKRTKEQNEILKKYPKILKISVGALYLYDREISKKYRSLYSKYNTDSKKAITAAIQKQLLKIKDAKIRKSVQTAALKESKKRSKADKDWIAKYPFVNIDIKNLHEHNKAAADALKKMKSEELALRKRERAVQLSAIRKRSTALRSKKPKQNYVRALTEVPKVVPETFFFVRGDFKQPKQKLKPSVLSITSLQNQFSIPINDPKQPTTGRRLAYANYLTSGKHPLVARVLVNRFWMHHFGTGIVSSPGDFGLLGERPSHPELLDWLATNFMENGWSVKEFHKLVMTSNAYQQALKQIPMGNDIDPDNRLLSGMPIRRLEAEVLRDSILKISGQLNTKQFGNPVPVMPDRVGQIIVGKANENAGRPGAKIDLKGEENRRSVYVQVRRSKPLAMLDMFDAPRMSPNCESRPNSTVAPQSLLLMNNEFVTDQSLKIAKRVIKKSGENVSSQIALAWKLTFGSEPKDQQLNRAKEFLINQTAQLKKHPEAQKLVIKDKTLTPEIQALASLCQIYLGSNQFLYID